MLNHVHHALPVCETGHKTPATHLHDERYNPDGCSVCAFLFAVPELVHGKLFTKTPKPLVTCTAIHTQKQHAASEHLSIQLRGPPAQQHFG